MENENIKTNETDMSVNSASTVLVMNDSNGTVSSTDIENGTVELILKQPFEGDDGGISVACVESGDSNDGNDTVMVTSISIYPANLAIDDGSIMRRIVRSI